jgi:hypothetical protein
MKGNILKLTALKKNNEWCDKSRVLLYACFQILVDFIEKEKPQRIVDYKHDKEQKKQWKELQTLYRYWKIDRPRLEKEMDRALEKSSKKNKMEFGPSKDGGLTGEVIFITKDKKARNLYWRLEDKIGQKDDEMLQRLINIRHHLWC